LNFIHHFWPSLFKKKNFLREFVTPIVKAKKGSETITFFTLREFKTWKEEKEQTEDLKSWSIKYYKGLGTSTN